MERRGKPKFKIIDVETGEEVQNCFVLFPEHDNAAVAALEEYANHTVNGGMANILKAWATRIRDRRDNPDLKQFRFMPSREEVR